MPSSHFPQTALIDIKKTAVEEALISTPVTIGSNASDTVATRATAAVAASSANQILPLAGVSTLTEAFIVMAIKSTGIDNTGDIYIGNATSQLIRLKPGAVYREQAPAGKKIDLNQVVIRVPTIGDGVVWQRVD